MFMWLYKDCCLKKLKNKISTKLSNLSKKKFRGLIFLCTTLGIDFVVLWY